MPEQDCRLSAEDFSAAYLKEMQKRQDVEKELAVLQEAFQKLTEAYLLARRSQD